MLMGLMWKRWLLNHIYLKSQVNRFLNLMTSQHLEYTSEHKSLRGRDFQNTHIFSKLFYLNLFYSLNILEKLLFSGTNFGKHFLE